MSAETLRKAAALMRERAEKATPGPWHPDAWYVVGQVPGGRPGGEVMAQARTTVGRLNAPHRANADHMASWHPVVALAVAGLLEAEASIQSLYPDRDDDDIANALAVATAYLGEATP